MKNGKLLASVHGQTFHVDIQKDQECLSMYHITENGLMIVLKNVGLTSFDTSFYIYLMTNTLAISLKIRWIKSRVLCIGFLGSLIFFGPSRHLIDGHPRNGFRQDFENALFSSLASSLCLMVLISICKTKIGTV